MRRPSILVVDTTSLGGCLGKELREDQEAAGTCWKKVMEQCLGERWSCVRGKSSRHQEDGKRRDASRQVGPGALELWVVDYYLRDMLPENTPTPRHNGDTGDEPTPRDMRCSLKATYPRTDSNDAMISDSKENKENTSGDEVCQGQTQNQERHG